MKKWILLATFIGFIMPLFWGILSFAYFTAPQSRWTDLFWRAVHVTCPLWDLQVPTVLTPFLNAGLYGLIVFGLGKLRVTSRDTNSAGSSKS